MRYILTGGGTGGHIYPNLAIADKIKEIDKESEIIYVGSKNGIENKIVTDYGIPIWYLDTYGLKRSLSFKNIKAILKSVEAIKKANNILDEFKPNVVIGTGGYVCFPIIYAASKKNIYTFLHESNAIPGLAIRLLKNKVDKIFVNFENCKDLLNSNNVIISGNPIRKTCNILSKEEIKKNLNIDSKFKYIILSFGGSLGADKINDCAKFLIKDYVSNNKDVLYVHVTGKNKYFNFVKEIGNEYENVIIKEYLYNMPEYMKIADVIISRSGAMTISEITNFGKASILVPSPNVTENHQYKNAMELAKKGAAFLVCEDGNEIYKVREYVETMIKNDALRKNMEEKSLEFTKNDAVDIIVNEIFNNALQNSTTK